MQAPTVDCTSQEPSEGLPAQEPEPKRARPDIDNTARAGEDVPAIGDAPAIDHGISPVLEVRGVHEPTDYFYSLWLFGLLLVGLASGFAVASEFLFVVRILCAAVGMALAGAVWLALQRARNASFLEGVSDQLERTSILAESDYLRLWRLVQRSAGLRWLLPNDNLLFDVLERISDHGSPTLPVRVGSALKQYARGMIWSAIDDSFKPLEKIGSDERSQVSHQRWVAFVALMLATLVAGFGCLASFGFVLSLPGRDPHGIGFVRDPTLVGTWASTTAVVGLSGVLLATAGMALRTLERHLTRALSLAERLRFASGLKASCGLDLHPFLAQFAPPSTAEMMRVVRDPKSYDLVSLSELVERPRQESAALGDVIPALKDLGVR